jgi:hypothetical protein
MSRIHTTTDPGKWQNELPQEPSGENYRGKSDIRQPSGGIEFINTKNEEVVTFYYSGGSFLRFNKFSTDLFVPVSMQTHVYGSNFEIVNKDKSLHVDGTYEEIHLGDKLSKTGDMDKTQKHAEDWLKNMQELHNMKRRFEIKRCNFHNKIDQAEGQTKSGTPAKCPSEQVSVLTLYTAQASIWTPSKKSKENGVQLASLTDGIQTYQAKGGGGGKAIGGGWHCMTCGGDGLSPSTQDGSWDKEEIKDKIKDKIIQLTKTLAESEAKFGTSKNPDGGTEVRTSNKNVVEQIGSVFNTLESYRKDPKGKLVPYGMKVDPMGAGIYPQFRESPLIETVHVDSVPGGQYHMNVCDKYTLSVGANGISMKTNGNIKMFGIQTDIVSERTTISARSEIIIGAERVDISGDIITIRPKKTSRTIEDGSGNAKNLAAYGGTQTEPEQQVFIDGNLNIGLNAIVAGGMHVEGELSIQHLTAPCEYQITDSDFEIGIQPRGVDGECGLITLGVVGEETEGDADVEKDTTHADLLPGSWIGYNEYLLHRTELAYCPCCDTPHYHDIVFPCKLINIISRRAPNTIEVHPHYHWFKNIPLNLVRDESTLEIGVGSATGKSKVDPNSAVRAIGAKNNFAAKNTPMSTKNSKTTNTSIEKLRT